MAKCNLGKVNLELMLRAVSPSLHMIRRGAPSEFAGGKLRTALLASDRCDHCFCERIFVAMSLITSQTLFISHKENTKEFNVK